MFIFKSKLFSDSEKKMRIGDRVHIGIGKIIPKKWRKDAMDALDDDPETAKKGRHAAAKNVAIVGGVAGAATGLVKGGPGRAVLRGATGAGKWYVAGRVGGKIDRVKRNLSSSSDAQARVAIDQLRVSNGDMSKEDFVKKYGTKHLI